ncbi:glycosyltransferase [Kordiimonas sp. SCSIO 12610]|uniref:glycosyltransferase n=1 Tax=Kordiimonas sp. SCSIO 12610 TaxID=2829597 RepID=UPI00210D32F5|nr:glycosyltransferase [Kordiimonas sp. SCSIO 12610]UTW56260.1 glycosyltransferase [Kordiimonas sp. SCSIO 12610]
MRILFMHNNFPGQYRRIANYLKKNSNHEMAVATLETNKQQYNLPKVTYAPHREARKDTHPALIATERATIMGQAAYQALTKLKKTGNAPDIILAHSGWGGSMFLKDVFPDAKLLSYFEWYYYGRNSDSSFISGQEPDPNNQLRIRMKNTPILQDLAAMDWGQCPTAFQHSKLPKIFQKNVSVLHDGVDTEFFVPDDTAKLTINENVTLSADDEVITYVARGMEEYRGFPQFMEVVSELQKKRPRLHVVILGNDRVAYGAQRKDGKSFKEWALETFEFDHSRLHFMGLQPLGVFKRLMQISSAHVYLTAPFVLSWSMLEAMSAGALIVGSDTEPVKELISDGENGILVPFFDTAKIISQLDQILNEPQNYKIMRQKARETILERYSIRDLLPKYQQLIENVANGTQNSEN